MTEKLDQSSIMSMLDTMYEKAVAGFPGVDSAFDMANDYLKQDGCKADQINALIRWQNAKAGTSGFITGLGGIMTLPVAIPANVASVMYVQVRMIAAIAIICGYDVRNDKVKTLVYACLTGNAAKDILKDIGISIGQRLATNAINNLSRKTIVEINKKVGFRLLTKFGEKGAINLGKAVPLIGGIVGATFDSVTTNTIGNIARDTFLSLQPVAEAVAD
jgi:uncharacterized protein (DUF697 family)